MAKRSLASRQKQAATLRATLRRKRLGLAPQKKSTVSRRELRSQVREARARIDMAIDRLAKLVLKV